MVTKILSDIVIHLRNEHFEKLRPAYSKAFLLDHNLTGKEVYRFIKAIEATRTTPYKKRLIGFVIEYNSYRHKNK